MIVASLHVPQDVLRQDIWSIELHICQMLVNACVKRHERRVAQRFSLTRYGDQQTVRLHDWKMTFFHRELSYKLIGAIDKKLVDFCAVEPGNCAAFPISIIVTLWR